MVMARILTAYPHSHQGFGLATLIVYLLSLSTFFQVSPDIASSAFLEIRITAAC